MKRIEEKDKIIIASCITIVGLICFMVLSIFVYYRLLPDLLYWMLLCNFGLSLITLIIYLKAIKVGL